MDNASFYHSERIEQTCLDAGVKLVYLSHYSPNPNPINELFAELKPFIKKQWHEYEDNLYKHFRVFPEWCVTVVGGRDRSAKAYFRHASVTVKGF